jgi:serine/threonine-protein kinase HipA
MEAFGMPVNQVEIKQFAGHRVLVIERFDRRWTQDGRLVRLPQEDCCQALSVAPTQKYQSQGGPGIVDIMELLQGSDNPVEDRERFFTTQLLFWLIGATDGHAKNFSVFLRPQNSFSLTPLYDVLTLQPFYDNKQLQHRFFKLSMSVGGRAQYQISHIAKEHFLATGRKAGLSKERVVALVSAVHKQCDTALQVVENELPNDFPGYIHDSVKQALVERLQRLDSE